MFDAYLSAVINALVGGFLAALLSRLLGALVTVMEAAQFGSESASGATQTTLVNALTVVSENWIRVALVAALMVPLARAVVESQVQGA